MRLLTKSPLKIVHLSKFLPLCAGGIEQATFYHAKAAAELGHDVEIIGIQPSKNLFSLGSLPTNVRLTPLLAPISIGPVPLTLGFFRHLKTIIAADLVVLHLPNPLAELAMTFALGIWGKKKRPTIAAFGHAVPSRAPILTKIWDRLLQRPLLAKVDCFGVSTRENLQAFPTYSSFVNKVYVLPYAIPATNLKKIGTKSGQKNFQLLAIGRLVSYKGFDVLIDAVAKINGDWQLKIGGSGPLAAKLQAQISELGLEGKISLLGSISEEKKQNLLAECDLFVVSSRTIAEAFCISMAEAFAHGKPVVATNLPTGVAFLARKGACGAVVNVNSADELAAAISRLMAAPELRQKYGQDNYDFWQNELSTELFNEKYENFLDHCFAPTSASKDEDSRIAS